MTRRLFPTALAVEALFALAVYGITLAQHRYESALASLLVFLIAWLLAVGWVDE